MQPKKAIDFGGLAALVKGHREGRKLKLREAASDCGVSASTLSRIERGEARPDLDTVKLLVDWVGVPLDRVVAEREGNRPHRRGPQSAGSPLESVEIQFRADPNLRPEAAEALIRIVREAYGAVTGAPRK